jgi:hypothetical protein
MSFLIRSIAIIEQATLCRLYVELVLGACVRALKLLKTPYYRSSSHTLCLKAPLGASKMSQGAHAPRDLACPNRLGVARERGYSRY